MEKMSHRYAAILAADVAHYSTLMEGDGEGTVQALKDCRSVFQRCVSEYHGREFGSVGDSLMAEFASPVEALRAARCIHSELEHEIPPLTGGECLRVRIGLHAGDVIEDDEVLFGDVVNTASRVQQLAQPGGTAVSELIHEHTRKEPGFEFRSLGKHSLKNIADPIQVYEVVRKYRRVNWRRMRLALRPYGSAITAFLGIAVVASILIVYLESFDTRGIGKTLEVPPVDNNTGIQEPVAARVPLDRPTDSVRAYQLFVEGRQLFHQRGPAVGGAIVALRGAVQHDPEFADAWAYLGAAASVAWGYDTGLSRDETDRLAEEATQKALELDSNSGLALAVRGNLAKDRRDYLAAAEYFSHAVRSDPGNSTVNLWAGVFYLCFGHLGEALASFERAYDLDPNTGVVNSYLGLTHLALGQSALAEPYFLKAEELAFFHHAAARFNDMIYSGELDKALDYREQFYSVDLSPGAATARLEVAEALRSGRTENVERLTDDGVSIHLLPGNWSMSLFLVLDLEDRYFTELSRTVADGPYWPMAMRFFWMNGNRKYIEHPRFHAIMEEAGVAEFWEKHGYPDECARSGSSGGNHLSCKGRFSGTVAST